MLAPARFEPFGLTPVYAMRYGSLPIVRQTGGMADTVTPANPEVGRDGAATGFAFNRVASQDMLASIAYALRTYEEPSRWRKMQLRAMRGESSWATSARRYVALYEELVGSTASRRLADRDGTNEP